MPFFGIELQGPRHKRYQSRRQIGVIDRDWLDILKARRRQAGSAVAGFADRRNACQHVLKNSPDKKEAAARVAGPNPQDPPEPEIIHGPLAGLAVTRAARGEPEI